MNNKLSQILKTEARNLGLCDEWFSKWEPTCSQQELIDKYVKGLDFAIKHNFPTPEFIDTHFDRELLHKNQIFCNEQIDVYGGGNGFYIVNGECTGQLHFHTCATATIYVRHNSKLKIKATRLSRIIVKVHDNAQVETECDAGSIIKVFKR